MFFKKSSINTHTQFERVFIGVESVEAVEVTSKDNGSLAQKLADTFAKSSIYENNQKELKKIDREVSCKFLFYLFCLRWNFIITNNRSLLNLPFQLWPLVMSCLNLKLLAKTLFYLLWLYVECCSIPAFKLFFLCIFCLL